LLLPKFPVSSPIVCFEKFAAMSKEFIRTCGAKFIRLHEYQRRGVGWEFRVHAVSLP
jgi:hypothetical protein